MNKCAYSLLQVKSFDEDQRVIRGIATSPAPDRVGDVIDPFGVTVAADIPLFLYHDSTKTVGRAKFGKPTSKGIPFEAWLPKVTEPGVLKDRVDEAWSMVRHGLLTAVSIGFRALDDAVERLKTGGLKFLKTEVLELSLVPVPAQAEAVIQGFKSMSNDAERQGFVAAIKALDTPAPAAPGQTSADADALANPPGDSGKANAAQGGAVQPKSRKPIMAKTISEQITTLENTRAAREARLNDVMGKALAEGRATDDNEAEEFDGIADELKRIDGDLVRLRTMEKLNIDRAKAVDGSGSDAGSGSRGVTPSRGPTVFVRSQDKDEAFQGQNEVRKIIAKAVAKIDDTSPITVAVQRWGKTNPTLVNLIKANEVPGGGTGSGEWGSELVTANTRYTDDFIKYLYGRTGFDQLPLRRIPENTMVKGQDGAATGYWVGESKAIPATTVDFFNVELKALKVAALAVISNDLIRNSSPDAEMLVRDALVEASAQRVDSTFFSNAAAVAGVSPAGILNGVTGIAASGTDAAALRADVRALYAPFIAAKNATDLQFVTNPSLAKAVQLMVNALGQVEFGNLVTDGLLGDPVRVADSVAGGVMILLKPSDIYRIGDLGVQMSVSRETMIEQSTAPTGATDTPVAASQAMTSMFQSESTAIKVVRPLAWAKRRASAVAFLTGAAYA